MKYKIVVPLVIAMLYSLLLNSGTIAALREGTFNGATVGIQQESADEAFYFAMINVGANGHWRLGSAALANHFDSTGNIVFGPLIQAAIVRFTGISVHAVIVLGDLLFPFLCGLALWFCLASFFAGWQRMCVWILLMDVIGAGWLRSVSPQITMLFFSVYLALFLSPSRAKPKQTLLRASVIAAFSFVQAQLSVLCVAAEGMLLLIEWIHAKSCKTDAKRILALCIPLGIGAVLQTIIRRGADPIVMADTLRRYGLIASHLPAAPVLQITLLVATIGIAWFTYKGKREFTPLLALCFAGFAVLNQSVVHGHDAIFGLYYHYPIMMIAILCTAVWITKITKNTVLTTAVLAVLAAWSLFGLRSDLVSGDAAIQKSARILQTTKTMDVIAWLKANPTDGVILAPFEIANLIPIYTKTGVLYNRYARFGLATDEELADRFVLYRTFFPKSDVLIDDPTHSLVFGQYAGNAAARKRTLCDIAAFLRGEKPDCISDIRAAIFHQELLPLLDGKIRVDTLDLLRKFNMSLIVSRGIADARIRKACPIEKKVNEWEIRACKSGF